MNRKESRFSGALGGTCLLAIVVAFLTGGAQLAAVGKVDAQSKNQPAIRELRAAAKGKIAPDLLESFQRAPGQPRRFLVYLKDQADLKGAQGLNDWEAKGNFVYDALKQKARTSQQNLLGYLETQAALGRVVAFKSFFIVNAIRVEAGEEVLMELAEREDVDHIEAIKAIPVPKPVVQPERRTEGIEWGVDKIRAPELWNEGVNGSGVVVANIDTGVQYSHGALVQQYRGTATGSHDYNWFDPTGTFPNFPGDNNGHGTHTMGTMVGTDGGSNQVGVAPSATWISCKGCESNSCYDDHLLACAEWVLAPTNLSGTGADPTKRPQVVNNSWGGGASCDEWYLASVRAWRAAGIFPAFSAGNSGPDSGTVGAPGNYKESFATGATDSGDVIAGFSSRGPSACPNSGIKPNVSAPGVNIRSTTPGGYESWDGTSMASPHTAGCVALLLSALPSTSIEGLESMLSTNAVDLGSPGPDYSYGNGRIDCYAALHGTKKGRLIAEPTSFEVTITKGAVTTRQLSLQNIGEAAASFEIAEVDLGTENALGKRRADGASKKQGLPTGRLGKRAGAPELSRQDLPSAQSLGRRVPVPAAALGGGTVIRSWDPGISAPWGIAYDSKNDTVWVSSPVSSWEGDGNIYEYGTDGEPTGRSWPYSWNPPYGPADAVFNLNTGTLWVMNVDSSGGKNCVHEIDPGLGYTGTRICPGGTGFSTSQRGLAYDPDTDSYYAGSWNDGMIHHFASNGTMLDEEYVGLDIAGLAYNPKTKHLFAVVSADPGPVYVLDAANQYSVLGSFEIPGFSGYSGAGLEIDCDGNLWAVDQNTRMVYQVESGEEGAGCKSSDVPWLSEAPTSGSVSIDSSVNVELTFDATTLEPATYKARLVISTNTGQDPIVVPVTLTVQEEVDIFTITATVKDGKGGSISPSGEVQVPYGSDSTFTIKPDKANGYKTVDVIVDGVSVGARATYTFSEVSANHTITAVFGKIVVTAPNGGEKWKSGSNHAITWDADGDIGEEAVITLLTRQGVKHSVIAKSARIALKKYKWKIPTKIPAGAYKIRISSKAHPKVKDTSNKVFKIIR
ncbi:MAG TPA: S8 family serine peptidase [Syntrophobacteraceae bacterium]|nr:S8 family serine peptidase [Syntrophobacteraceae bacterium]